MRIRDAIEADLPEIVALTRRRRRELALFAPVYWRPRERADDMHAAFLGFLVKNSDHRCKVVLDAGQEVVGFYQVTPQAQHRWLDDLCVADEALWPVVVPLLEPEERPWVTCVPRADERLGEALRSSGIAPVSTYFSRILDGSLVEVRYEGPDSVPPPRHTFGGATLSDSTEGALCVLLEAGGRAVGSPSVNPPTYDPGGPTCVVDQIEGPKRGKALGAALRAATARGDHQMIVVVGVDDAPLIATLEAAGFRPPVDLYCAEAA